MRIRSTRVKLFVCVALLVVFCVVVAWHKFGYLTVATPRVDVHAKRVSTAALAVARSDIVSATYALGGSGALLDVHVPHKLPTGTVVIVFLGGGYGDYVEFPYAPIVAWLIPRGVTVALLKVSTDGVYAWNNACFM